MKMYQVVTLALFLATGLIAVCLGFGNVNTPIQQDPQGISEPRVTFLDTVTENWSGILAQAEIGVTSALLPNMALADIDPDNPIPGYGPYPHLFKDGDNVSFTMLDRALSQQELVRNQIVLIQTLQAQTSAFEIALASLTSSINGIKTELAAGTVEAGKLAASVDSIVTNGVSTTMTQDNATLVAALQQLIQTLQADQTF